jgi:hypothetical protein
MAMVLGSTFLISHFEFFGALLVCARLFGRQPQKQVFKTPLLYRSIRHPFYLGFLLALWSTPLMSAGAHPFCAGDYRLHPDRHTTRGAGPHPALRMLFPLPRRKPTGHVSAERLRGKE